MSDLSIVIFIVIFIEEVRKKQENWMTKQI